MVLHGPCAISGARCTAGTKIRHQQALFWFILGWPIFFCGDALAGEARSIDLTANPDTILANGQSESTVTATVRDEDGQLVADGTVVQFTATEGTIPSQATTVRGVAQVRLRSGGAPTQARIIASSGRATAQILVDFVAKLAEAYTTRRYLTISADYLAYDAGSALFDALGNVHISYGPYKVEADSAQVFTDRQQIAARKNALIKSSLNPGRRGDLIVFNYNQGTGFMIDSSGRRYFSGMELAFPENPPSVLEPPNQLLDLSASPLVITASSARFFPGKSAQFRHATLYYFGSKLLSFPHYEYNLASGTSAAEQYIGYGAAGLSVNFPYYLEMTESRKSSLAILRSPSAGWGSFSVLPGWALGLKQSYDFGGKASGDISAYNLTRKDWGVSWNDSRIWDDRTRSFSSFSLPNHRDFYATANISCHAVGGTFALSLFGSRLQGQDLRSNAGAYYETDSRKIPILQANATAGLRSDFNLTGHASSRTGESVFLNVNSSRRWLGDFLPLSLGITASCRLTGSQQGTEYTTSLAGSRNIGPGSLLVGFSLSRQVDGTTARRLSSGYNLSLNRFSLSYYTSYDLIRSDFISFGSAYVKIPGAYKLVYNLTQQSLQDVNYTDYEFGFARSLGGREARLIWSKSRGRFLFELAGAQF
jgi:hypothetical protein